MKKKISKTKKIIAIVTSVIVVVCLALGGWYLYQRNTNKWDIKQDTITVEYGETFEPTLQKFVDTSAYPRVTVQNSSLEFDIPNEADKEYPAVGVYEIIVKHKIEYKVFDFTLFSIDDSRNAFLKVADTIAPVFAEDVPTELETYKDCEIENIEEYFTASDKATVSITIDKENIDYATVGEYITNVCATDASGNITQKEIKIRVLEPTIEVDKTSLNIKVGATNTITATVKGKSQEIKWTSSNEKVAKVDNGTVTAVKEGTATIKAEANGVKASINVTVTKVEQKTTTALSNNNNKSSSSSSNSGNASKTSSNGSNSSSSSNNSSSSRTTTVHDHSNDTGNCGRWFNSYSELFDYYAQWANKQGGNYSGYFNAWLCDCGKWSADFISY